MDWWAIISNTLRAGISASAIIYALAAIGLNLHFGYTGLLNFGQVGFMAAGAYGLGITTYTYGWPLWAGILAGLGAGVLLGVLLGAPTLRLRADYLAIVTIAAGEIIRIIVRAAVLRDVTGGSNGLNGFANEFQDVERPLDPSSEYGGRLFGKLNLRVHRRRPVGDDRRLEPRRTLRAHHVAARVEPVGPGAASRSARTRMPPARSARTCSASRCSR